MPIYGSGGFCSYSRRELARAARRLGRAGDPAREDEGRTRAGARPGARRGRARGDRRRRRALRRRERRLHAQAGARARRSASPRVGVTLVRGAGQLATTSTGCGLLRDRAPAGMDIAAGEYALRRSPTSAAARAAPSTASRPTSRAAAAITGLLAAAALAQRARARPLGPHCAPTIRAHALCAVADGCAISSASTTTCGSSGMLFDGFLEPERRRACGPIRARPGLGRRAEARATRSASPLMRRARRARAAIERRRRGARRATLRGAIEGEVRFDAGDRALYATDAARTTARSPIGVVIPQTIDDVVATVASAASTARRSSPAAAARASPARLQRRRRDRLLEVPAPDPRDRPRAPRRARRSRACVLDHLREQARASSTGSRSARIRRRTPTARSAG